MPDDEDVYDDIMPTSTFLQYQNLMKHPPADNVLLLMYAPTLQGALPGALPPLRCLAPALQDQ